MAESVLKLARIWPLMAAQGRLTSPGTLAIKRLFQIHP